MNLKEANKKIFKEASFIEKIELILWGWYFSLEHYFRKFTKICPHDATVNKINNKTGICLDCGKIVNISS